MPPSLATPVLQVDTNVIHQLDANNPDNLHGMWTVFARCAPAVAQGRRLENFSWRLWNRETFCCETTENLAVPSHSITLPQQIQRSRRSSPSDDVPQLSGSVDSLMDEEAVDDFHSETPAMQIFRPVIRRQDSTASTNSRSRGKERHITSDNLEKMVVNIIQAKEDLSSPLPGNFLSPFKPQPAVQTSHTPPTIDICRQSARTGHSGSTTSESSVSSSDAASVESNQQPSPTEVLVSASASVSASQIPAAIVVRTGFSPSSNPLCRITSQIQKGLSPSAIPAPTAAPAAKFVQPKGKMAAHFAAGVSSGDDSYSDRGSLVVRAQQMPQRPKKSMFQLGGSSEENSLESPQQQQQQQQQQDQRVQPPQPQTQQQLRQQHQNMMQQQYANSSAVEDDDDDDAIYDESAIDDEEDDSSEWEDSNEESGKSSMDSKQLNFKRVDSSVNLTSRRSLITLMLAQNDSQVHRSSMLASQSTSALPRAPMASQQRANSSSPNDSDDAPLMMKRGVRAPHLNPIKEIPRSGARPIVATASANLLHSNMLSPKTTRRNMMATELTESLRRHLVWERRLKNSNHLTAALPRRYTSNDVANLKQHPEKPFMNARGIKNSNSNNNNNNTISQVPEESSNFEDEYTGNSYHTHGW